MAGDRVASAEQRASPEGAFRGLTIDGAYALRQEDDRGSIEAGEPANFTILDENPLTVDAMSIRDIGAWGTVVEGQKFKTAQSNQRDATLKVPADGSDKAAFAQPTITHVINILDLHG